MKTKAKKFSRKLLALFLAVLMAATCFSGVMTSYAASSDTKYVDGDVTYNDLAWNILTDEQVATSVLDYADQMLPALKELEPTLAELINEADIPVVSLSYNLTQRQVSLNLGAINLATITIKLGSVDELLETINSVQSVLDGGLIGTASGFGVDLGFIKDLNLSAVNGMRRSNTSSCDIVRGVLGLLYDNNDKVLGALLRGTFSTGVIGLDIYQTLGDLVGGIDSGYQSNFVYNFVQALLFRYTEWFTAEEIAAFKADPTTFVYDDVLLEKMTVELLDKINVLVTYADGTSSASRRAEIDTLMEGGATYADACAQLGYDPNLVYSEENTGNILLFQYGTEKLHLDKGDSLFTFGYRALDFAWKTVLNDTLNLVHVNNSVERGHGTNFDNAYYYWVRDNMGWDTSNVASNYTAEKVQAWAEAVYASYNATDATEFLGWVEDNYVFDRTIADDAAGNWRDIDETTLFNKLRYSPLADYYFDMQTGPINLYFSQTGTPNMEAFFETYDQYDSLVGGLNDCLVAAVKDFFPGKDNTYVTTKGDSPLPTMTTLNITGTIGAEQTKQITSTIVGNALDIVQYVADTTDQNILGGFYKNNGGKTDLTETNLEEAMIPLLVACIGQVNLSGYKLEDMIHPEDWDRCLDAEAVAFIALREYLSYVLPNKDYNSLATFNDTKITADFDTCLLPMARDAIIYVIEPYVPVTDKDGKKWTAATDTIDTTTSIFDLLNSVVCYYADDYTIASRSGETALGVASLLGACDTSGNSLINTGNSLWTNIDIIVNEFFPVIGTLTGDGYGAASSENLIMGDIVNGILEIGKQKSNGLYGVSNFVNKLLTIVSAEPIQTTPVTLTVYDLVKDLLNGLFGPRYNGQEWVPVPDRTSDHPWDDVLQVGVIAGTEGAPGVLGKALNNFVEFSGFGYNGVKTYPDSILAGLCFAVTAVNSFVNMLPLIGEHNLQMATAEFADPAIMGMTSGGTKASSVTITNNAVGVNVAYVDGMNDAVEQMSRYYIKVTGATINGTSNASIGTPSSDLIAPGESLTLSTSTTYVPESDTDLSSSYTVTFTYDICDASGNTLYSNLTTNAYQYLNGEVSWRDTVYPEDRYDEATGRNWLPEALENNDYAPASKTLNGYTVTSTEGWSKGKVNAIKTDYRLVANIPNEIVLSNDNLSEVNTFAIRVRNVANALGADAGMDGIFFYDEGNYYDDASGTDVAIGIDNAVPIFDKETGAIIKYGLYDISYDGGETYHNGEAGGTGYTQDEINTILQNANDNGQDVNQIRTRDHRVYTFAQLTEAGIVAAYHKDENTGIFEYIYLKSGSGEFHFDTLLGNISCRGPVEGFYINSAKQTVSKASALYFNIMQYDGVTDVPYTNITAHVAFYSSQGSGKGSFQFIVADMNNSGSITSKYEELQNLMAQYTANDFQGGQATYDTAKDAIVSALAATATPITPTSAVALSDKTVLTYNTGTSTSTYGDPAYKPLDDAAYNALSEDAKALVYRDSSTGKYYLDALFSRPAYTTVALEDADVTDGKDSSGVPVIKVDGVWYVANSVQYATEWDTTTFSYPAHVSTGEQATNASGELLYDQIQWAYYNAGGFRVSSNSTWVLKAPDTSYQLPLLTADMNDATDPRGAYSKNNDNLDYVIEYVKNDLKAGIADTLLTDVSLVRNGLNETNFEIVTYNKMVDMAKEIESKYSIEVVYDRIENQTDAEGNVMYDDKGDPIKVTNEYTETVNFNTYSGLLSDENVTIKSHTVISELSSTQVAEYKRLFNIFLGEVVERGYLGDRMEDEVLCASGSTYDALTVEVSNDAEGNADYSTATISRTSTSTTPEFGVFSADGQLVNDGDVVYPTNLWNNYTAALARAVDLAQLGNGTYAYKSAALFDPNGEYTARVTSVYDAKIDLQAAEIALENTKVLTLSNVEGGTVTVNGEAYTKPLALPEDEYVELNATAAEGYSFVGFQIGDELITELPYSLKMDKDVTVANAIFESAAADTITVSGRVMIATDTTGTNYTSGIVGINILANGEVVGTSAADGTFSVTVPAGTTELTFQGDTTIDRTVTLSGTADVADAIVPIVICDYNRDTYINSADILVFTAAYNEYNVYADFNSDGNVNAGDAGTFSTFLNKTVAYTDLTLG